MFYAIICEDVEQSLDARKATRPAHLERLQSLQKEGRLLIAGPHPNIDSDDPGESGFSGSLIVAEFNSIEDACSWADEDPYESAGVYASVTVKPFKRVFPQ